MTRGRYVSFASVVTKKMYLLIVESRGETSAVFIHIVWFLCLVMYRTLLVLNIHSTAFMSLAYTNNRSIYIYMSIYLHILCRFFVFVFSYCQLLQIFGTYLMYFVLYVSIIEKNTRLYEMEKPACLMYISNRPHPKNQGCGFINIASKRITLRY